MAFGPAPRRRRLISDHQRLRELATESTIFSFEVAHPQPSAGPPETYRIRLQGAGLHFAQNRSKGQVSRRDDHEIMIQLVAEYPRSAPHMRWMTPIYHPNISASGAVCLGGWGTHWAPSLTLDRLCEMLWDMLRFANYDTRSPFNQQAATWLRGQREFRFPLDNRELRDLARTKNRIEHRPAKGYRVDQDQVFDAVVIQPSPNALPEPMPPEPESPKPVKAEPIPDILFLD